MFFYGCETWSLTMGEEPRLRVFENRVLRKIFEPKRNEVTGEWRKLHKEEFHEQCNSRSIIGVNKSRTMRWAGYVAMRGRGEVHTEFWWRERDQLEVPGIDGSVILSWFFRKWDGSHGLD